MTPRKFTPTKTAQARVRARNVTVLISIVLLFGIALTRTGVILNAFGLRRGGKYDCMSTVRLGDAYGGWVMCKPVREELLRGKLVYTIGVGRNVEWDKEMIRRYGTMHFGWDPTPTAVGFVKEGKLPVGMTFVPIGLGVRDGNLTLKLPTGNKDSYAVMGAKKEAQEGTVIDVPVLTVKSMMKRMGHRRLAILKMDVEGAEFDVLRKWKERRYRIPADQLLVEFHERYFGKKELVDEMVDILDELGFKMVVRTTLECTFINRRLIR